MTAKIAVLGSFNADLVTYLARFPTAGETVQGTRFMTGPGGKGSNQAVAAARLGAQVTFIGRVGRDSLAQIGRDLWRSEGIRADTVAEDADHATGTAIILVEDSGENEIVVTLGANLQVQHADLEAAREAIETADILMTQLETNLDAVETALQMAYAAGVTTLLNPAPAPDQPLSQRLLAYASILTPNETELRRLAGTSDLAKAHRALGLRPEQRLVVTQGSTGAAWHSGADSGSAPAFKVKAVDTVGAGDAFNAGLAVALAEGQAMPQALRFANAVAALTVTREGAAAAMPRRAEVEALLAG